ncbi:GNAT family N-acetyltransferase [Crocinitomicaceae bacterium]|nr:GNAT family N-acetyltransferase [Crocinitomicaceae bacterium]
MVTCRLANSDDYINVNAFYNRIYKVNRTIEKFLWEFNDCPFGKSIYVIAEDNEKIVGTNCVIPIDLITSDNRIVRTGKSEDTLVDPEYRGQKIFYKIYDFLFEKCKDSGIQIIWGFTPAQKPFENLGFEIPYSHQQALAVNYVWKSYKFLSSLNDKNKSIDKLKILALCIMAKAKSSIKLIPLKSTYRIEKVDKIVSGVADLIFANQMKVDNTFAIHQSSEFQEWRIYSNPNFFKTHTYGAYDNKKLVALIVFNSHKNNVAYICQSTFHPDIAHPEKVKILKSVTGMLYKEGIALVRTWLFPTNTINLEEVSIFNEAKYMNLNRGIGLVWKDLSNTSLKPENFILSRIATQGVI